MILNLRRAGGRGTPTSILKRSAPRPLVVEVHTSKFLVRDTEMGTRVPSTEFYRSSEGDSSN